MKRLNKKAQEQYSSDTFVSYLVFSIFLSIALILFMVVIYNHLEWTGKVPDGIEEFSAIERFQSEDCFALKNKRLPIIINWDEFTNENLNRCYNINKESKKIAFNLTLKIPDNVKGIKTANWNEGLDPKRVKKPMDVNVYYKNEILNGELIIREQNV